MDKHNMGGMPITPFDLSLYMYDYYVHLFLQMYYLPFAILGETA
jgi:hypothetical protein